MWYRCIGVKACGIGVKACGIGVKTCIGADNRVHTEEGMHSV